MTHADVVQAAQRIAGQIERTPLIESEVTGSRVWLKCECLQTGGAFKLRGATNRLLQLSSEERERGVVAFSSGNHARGVALAARRLGIRAVIVMPADAPQVKVEGTRSEGAEIIFYDRRTESREEIAAKIWDDMGRSLELGEIVAVPADAPDTFCDALQTPRVSPITFDILRKRGAEALSVSDTEVADAMRFAWEKHGLVVEPGGAVALAALLTGKAEPREATVVVVSGGNIDPALHARIIANAV